MSKKYHLFSLGLAAVGAMKVCGDITYHSVGRDVFVDVGSLDNNMAFDDSNLAELARGIKANWSKEEYIDWRTAWRHAMKDLEGAIILMKTYRDDRTKTNRFDEIHPYRQSDVRYLRKAATSMYELRRLSKIVAAAASQRKFAQEKAAAVAA